MKKTFDLGFKPSWWPGKDDYEDKKDKEEKKEPPTYHPSFNVTDPKLVAALMNMRDGTATITFHVASIKIQDSDSARARMGMCCGDGDTGCNVEIEVLSMTVDTPVSSGKDELSAVDALSDFLDKKKDEDSEDEE